MKLGSLFDGSGGFPLAGTLCGITPVFASEIEPYPVAVTTSRFPNMLHLGDISKINGAEIPPVTIITFGSPCQDLSVAGKRAGLKHSANGDDETTRSGLFIEAVRIIKEMRRATNGKYPRYAVWENVMGAFSSNAGNDFRVVLEELIKIAEPEAPPLPPPGKAGWPYADCIMGDGWSLAWRSFDAQYWGVAQRRRRLYALIDLAGDSAPKVLFERPGLRGYFEKGRSPWQDYADPSQEGPGANDTESGCVVYDSHPQDSRIKESNGIAPTVAAKYAKGTADTPLVCVATQQGGAEITENGICPTVTAAAGMSGNNQPWICAQAEPGVKHKTFVMDQLAGQGEYYQESTVSSTLRAGGLGAVAYCYDNHSQDTRYKGPVEVSQTVSATFGAGGNNQPFVVEQEQKVFCKGRRAKSADDYTAWKSGTVANTLNTFDTGEVRANELVVESAPVYGSQSNTIDRPAVAYATDVGFFNTCEDVSPSLLARGYKDPHLISYEDTTEPDYIVRRLTPIECARLQGFPDTWGIPNPKEDLTDEEYSFWLDVRNTHATINGKKTKEYTRAQMLAWYNKLHSDSSEYKMWGNGIALPNALYVMQGIAEELQKEMPPTTKDCSL